MKRTAALSRDALIDEAKGRSTADVVWWTVAAAVFLIPLVVDPLGKDPFRIPKELLFRFFAIVVAALLATNWTWKNVAGSGKFLLKSVWSLSLAIAGWTIVTTMTSTNVTLSVDSLITALCSVAFFFGARVAIRRHPSMRSLDVVLPAAIINALLAMSQEFGVWQPFEFPLEFRGHVSTTALLGNPNDAGMYLLAPALACVVATDSCTGIRRTSYLMISALLLGGLIACGTRTVWLAWTLGVLVATIKWTGRRAFVWTAVGVVLALALSSPAMRSRFYEPLVLGVNYGRYDVLFSERLPAFLTAIDMTRDHPFAGVGPGAFKWNYFQYRVRIAEKYPEEWTRGWPAMFRETHNDHLQILSETGLPGYALFVVAAGIFAVRARRTDSLAAIAHGPSVPGQSATGENDQFQTFADRLRLPLAVALIVLMLAQFPLQIAAGRVVLLYFLALCTWRNP